VSYSKCVYDSFTRPRRSRTKGIDRRVIDLRTLNPARHRTVVESVQENRQGRMLVYEGWKTGGAGAEIASQIYEVAFESTSMRQSSALANARINRFHTTNIWKRPALPSPADIVKGGRTHDVTRTRDCL